MTSSEPPPTGEMYAGFWIRVWASVIDTVLVAVIVGPLLWAWYGPEYARGLAAALSDAGLGDPVSSTALIAGPVDFLLSWVFPAIAIIVFWIYRSATPGKMAIRARIVDARTGERPTNAQLIGRYFGYYLSLLPLGLGFFWVGWDSRKQGLHDKLAGTVVMRRKRGH